MIEYIISLLLAFLTWFVHRFYIRPQQQLQKYRKRFEQRGYKVYCFPFEFLQVPVFKSYVRNGKTGDAMRQCKDVYSKYDVVLSNVVSNVKVDLLHPDLLKEFFSYENIYNNPKAKGLMESVTRWDGVGLISSEGEEWKQRRKILNRLFNFDFVKGLSGNIAEICDFAIRDFESSGIITTDGQGKKWMSQKIINLSTKIFASVIMESFLGGAIRYAKIEGVPAETFTTQLMADIFKQFMTPWTFLFGKKYLDLGLTKQIRETNRQIQVLRQWGLQFIGQRIREMKEAPPAKGTPYRNIIEATLLSEHSEKDQLQYDQETLLAEFIVFFVAGTETTSHFLEMMIYLIAQHPSVEKKVRQEIDLNIKDEDGDGAYSYENLKKLKYLENVQKEVTRFYGPGNGLFIREAAADYLLDGIRIDKGTQMTVIFIANHYNENYFKNPKQFRPERWDSECDNLPPLAMTGFSAGGRSCIGKHLALLESKIALIKFLKRYKQIKIPKEHINMEFKFTYAAETLECLLQIDTQ